MFSSVNYRHSLSRRLLKIVLSIYFGLTFVTTAIHVYLEYSSTKEDINRELQTTQRAFESSLASSLWVLDSHQLEITARGITESPLVTGIEIKDEFNQVVVQILSNSLLPGEKVSGVFWHEFPLHIEFHNENRKVGHVRLFSNEEIVLNRIRLGIQILIINAVLKTFALVLLITVVFNFLLTKPLSKLANDASSIDLNNIKEKRINVDTKDTNELKTLEIALNNMIEKIAHSMANLDTLNKNLEEKVSERTITLQKSLNDLKQAQDQLVESEKMASLGSLVAGIAHEINTPVGVSLTGISHFQYLLEKIESAYRKDDLEEAQFEKFLSNAKQVSASVHISLERAAEMVSSFKQVAVDQSSEQKRVFNLKENIEQVLLSLQSQLKPRNIQVEFLCTDDVEINSYPGPFSQIVTNLITNSLIHGFSKEEKGIISIHLQESENEIGLTYQDNGKGMNSETKTKAFDPFYTTNRENGGSGLGLNIIYNIVTQKLKGNITLDSEPNQGSKFTIIVPTNPGE